MHRSALVFLMVAALSGCGGAKKSSGSGAPPPTAPVITSNGGGASATRNVAENGTAVTTVTATDANAGTTFAYSISGGADAAKFAINSSSGVLTFVSAPDFESPTDAGANNGYDVTVQVSDGALTDMQAIAVTVTDINEAPVITSDGGGASATRNVAENGTAVTTVTSTDVDAGTTLTFSISGGSDAAKFAINSSSGVLTFVSAPDFEAPTDAGANNVYDVTVRVSDGALTDTQAIAVTVTDVNEVPGTTTLNFSTYLGNQNHDFVRDVAVDGSGNVYAVGGAQSSDLPTTAGTAQPTFGGTEDAFIVKFNPQGTILWSTFLGGIELDRAYAVEVVGTDVIVAGRCGASFPVTAGVIQTQFQGGLAAPPLYPTPQDGFVAKLRASDGTKVWATFFGAAGDSHASIVRDIAVDPATGFIYLAASTDTGNYTPAIAAALLNGHQSTRRGGIDGVLAKLSSNGQSMPWATYVGGTADESAVPSVRVDSQGNPIVLYTTQSSDAETTAGVVDRVLSGAGDFYLAKFALNGTLSWASFVGGSDGEGTETHNLAIRGDDTLVIAGASRSTDFTAQVAASYDSTQNGNGGSGTGAGTNYPTDCAIAIVAANGSFPLIAATYYGGAVGEACEGVGADSNNNIYVTGGSFSANLPVTSGAYQNTKPGTVSPFIAVFNRDLTKLRYSSYYGGSGNTVGRDLAVHGEAHFVIGAEAGAGWPLQNAVRSNVNAAELHGGVADVTVPLGPG